MHACNCTHEKMKNAVFCPSLGMACGYGLLFAFAMVFSSQWIVCVPYLYKICVIIVLYINFLYHKCSIPKIIVNPIFWLCTKIVLSNKTPCTIFEPTFLCTTFEPIVCTIFEPIFFVRNKYLYYFCANNYLLILHLLSLYYMSSSSSVTYRSLSSGLFTCLSIT